MKFLILPQYYPPEVGAPQVRLQAMIRELAAKGHQVEVGTAIPNHPLGRYFPGYKSRMYSWEISQGIKIHRTWIYPAIGAGLKRIFNYLSFTLSSFWGMMKAGRPDLVWVESPPLFLGWTAMAYSRFRRVPFIFNIADLWPDSIIDLGLMRNGLAARMLYMAERAIYNRAKYVIAVTQGIRDRLINSKGLPARKILYLPNGVDTEMFRPVPYDLALSQKLKLSEKKVILYAGTHGYAHNIDVALRSAHLLKNENLFFLFIGDGSEKTRLVKLSAMMKLDNVKFLPSVPVEELVKYYSIAFAGLSTLGTSRLFESTRPAKVLSIMATGKPVIYSGRGEGANIVEKANAGIVVPPDDEDALSFAIKRIARDKAYAENCGQNGRKYVSDNLSWKIVVDNWLNELGSCENDENHK
jgi:glycosyltransferase involved in cell wall biosynthesis